jgi:hypothetical protein
MDGLDRHTLADILPPVRPPEKPGTGKRATTVRMRVA